MRRIVVDGVEYHWRSSGDSYTSAEPSLTIVEGGLAQPGVRSLEQGDFLCRRRPGGLELGADPRALLPRGEELFLHPGPRSVALRQQGRELCGASSVEHAPDNRRGRDGDEEGDQRQRQVHDARFTTRRLFFALNP